MTSTIAFLGPHGTFTEEAARSFPLQSGSVFKPYGSIIDVIAAVHRGDADYGVVPMENSIEGSVNATLDWLIHEVDLPIIAELALPISQHLLVAKRDSALTFEQITKVLSHPHAVAQCHTFIQNYLPHAEIEYTNSTALAGQMVSSQPGESWAAIGPRLAAEVYPLQFAKQNIEDYQNNYTKFVLISKQSHSMPEAATEKTTILVTLPEDFPGALYQVLAAFAWRKINLSRIESRPTKKGLGSYYFVIDIEQRMDDVLLPGAFAEIEALGCQIRSLGTYPFYVKEFQPSTT
ncbi:prephenate dehydratase [Brevibacillus sp. SYSU BS000544]|uniref:prephenate dehydratase n=1 Tax=Brevibacillus sp. SYSU BS000544 TaxID=3416443 RepID=UPI003CE4DBBA